MVALVYSQAGDYAFFERGHARDLHRLLVPVNKGHVEAGGTHSNLADSPVEGTYSLSKPSIVRLESGISTRS